MKNIDPKQELERTFLAVCAAQPDPKEYIFSVRRVAAMLSAKNDQPKLTETDILASLTLAAE